MAPQPQMVRSKSPLSHSCAVVVSARAAAHAGSGGVVPAAVSPQRLHQGGFPSRCCTGLWSGHCPARALSVTDRSAAVIGRRLPERTQGTGLWCRWTSSPARGWWRGCARHRRCGRTSRSSRRPSCRSRRRRSGGSGSWSAWSVLLGGVGGGRGEQAAQLLPTLSNGRHAALVVPGVLVRERLLRLPALEPPGVESLNVLGGRLGGFVGHVPQVVGWPFLGSRAVAAAVVGDPLRVEG